MRAIPLSAILSGWLAIGLIATLSAVSQTTQQFPRSTVLSDDDVSEAVRLGQSTDVMPYIVSRSIGGGPVPRLAVYTPFVRVAAAARAQVPGFDKAQWRREGLEWMTSPEVLVVIGNPCSGNSPECDMPGQPIDPRASGPNRVYISPRIHMYPGRTPQTAEPVRIVPLHQLAWLGAVPIEEPVVAATFSPDAFRVGSYVIAEWGRWDSVSVVAGGYLRAEDLESWR